jgi:hypothetical protein
MNPIPSPVDGITIERDLQRDLWRLHAGGPTLTLRPWTWGERRRLVEFATAGTALNRAAFVDGLFDLLLDPAPSPGLHPGLAFTCMYLLGIPERDAPVSLARAEFLIAATFGWAPQQISNQPAAGIDALVEQIQPRADADGWTRIVIVDAAIESRLESMFQTIAFWAGLASAPGFVAPNNPEARAQQTIPAPATERRPDSGGSPLRDASAGERRSFESTLPGTARLIRQPNPSSVHSRRSPSGEIATNNADPASRPNLTNGGGVMRVPQQKSLPDPTVGAVYDRPRSETKSSPLKVSRPELDPLPQTPARSSRIIAAIREGRALKARPMPAPPLSPPHAETRDNSDFFPAVRIQVRWPEEHTAAPAADAAFSAASPLPSNPFAQSEFEEQMADVLDRAAREAGVDLP